MSESLSLGKVLSALREDLTALGWHVEVTEDSGALHRFLKNGKPRRAPEVTLHYDEFTFDAFVEEDGKLREVKRPSARPYCLASPGLEQTRTFTSLPPAVALFWEEARKLAPLPPAD